MKYYRCYLLTDEGHIARAKILKCADEADAARQCRDLVPPGNYAGAEVWDGARQVCRYPEDLDIVAAARPRRRDGATDQDAATADVLGAQVVDDHRMTMEADAIRTALLREQHLEREAAATCERKNGT